MANNKTYIIKKTDKELYWLDTRDKSPYIHLWWKLKLNGKWTGSKRSLKTLNWEEARDKAFEIIDGGKSKSLRDRLDPKKKTFEEWKDEFLRGFPKETTRRGYEKDIDRFIEFMRADYPESTTVDELEYTHLKNFESYEKNRPNRKDPSKKLSENTVKGAMKTLGSWLGEAEKHEYSSGNPMAKLKVGGISSRKEIFYPDEILKMTTAKKDTGLHAVIMLLLQRGVRKEEIINARAKHFKKESRVLEIPETKEKKPKKISLPRLACNAICKLPEINEYLFPNPHKSDNDEWVKLDKDIRIFCKGLGIKGNTHKFRHTFCSYSLHCRGDKLMEIKKMMGHSSLQTTEKYNHIIDWKVSDRVRGVFSDWGR